MYTHITELIIKQNDNPNDNLRQKFKNIENS